MVLNIEEWKGHKVVSLVNDVTGQCVIKFGLIKAEEILKHVDGIQAFVKKRRSERQSE